MFLAHITNEAVRSTGEVGAVLDGLMTSRAYKGTVKRTVLAGVLGEEARALIGTEQPDLRLVHAKDIAEDRTAAIGLLQVERRYGVEIFHGVRKYVGGKAGVDNEAEVLLIDVSEMPADQVAAVKQQIHQRFDLPLDKMRLTPEQDAYVRLAVPAYEALLTLRRSKDGPCVMISHDWYGLPLGLWITARADRRFRTVFHAHDVPAVRSVVEKHPGHDLVFQNVMRQAYAQGKFFADVFEPQETAFKPAMVMRTHLLQRILAVSELVVEQLRFLGPSFRDAKIELVYSGIPLTKVPPEAKAESHVRLQEYARRLLSWRPDFILSHTARAEVSKAFWRDLHVMADLDARLAEAGEKAVFFISASAGRTRAAAEVAALEKKHDWPLEHVEGYPDLEGVEVNIDRYVRAFNKKAKAARAILLNQVGWQHEVCGNRMPKTMLPTDIRIGSDVEFGLSAYEPFGATPIEPLLAGTVCVLSRSCGGHTFVERVDVKKELPNAIIRDYGARLANASVNKLLKLTARDAAEQEKPVDADIAEAIFKLLPRSDKDYKRYLALGYRYGRQMSWDVVSRDFFLPAMRTILT